MILDKLESSSIYLGMNPNFEKAFKFLKETDISTLEDGRYEIDGDKIYALVQSYITLKEEEKKFEAHEKYIDIQYIFRGKESIAWAPINLLELEAKYSKDKDISFYKNADYFSIANLKSNYFCIFYPKDAHKPGFIYEEPSKVKKVVVKIKL